MINTWAQIIMTDLIIIEAIMIDTQAIITEGMTLFLVASQHTLALVIIQMHQ